MFKFNGMPYKRSGRAGGKSVSTIGMLVLLLAALLVLPSCFDDDDDGASIECGDGTELNAAGDACVAIPVDPVDPVECGAGSTLDPATNTCEVDPVDMVECGAGSTLDVATNTCEVDPVYDEVGELAEGECYMDGDRDGMVLGKDPGECIMGEGGNDSIKGMGGNDNIDAGPGDDNVYGGDGDDILVGGTGDDTLNGGAGNDELTGGSGNNTLDGGDGDEDIAIFLGAQQVTAGLDHGAALVRHATAMTGDGYLRPSSGDSGVGTDTLTNIENVKGTHGNDIINGNEKANLLKGLDGADLINGNDGDDTILPNRPAMDLSDPADGTLDANVATLTDPADATVDGGVDGVDVVDGGEGSDTISYEGESASVTVDLSADTTPGFIAAVEDEMSTPDVDETAAARFTATIGNIADLIAVVDIGTEDEPNVVSTIENVTGGFGVDTLTGDARANTLSGGGDGDTLSGNGGDDTLNGGAGNDTLKRWGPQRHVKRWRRRRQS